MRFTLAASLLALSQIASPVVAKGSLVGDGMLSTMAESQGVATCTLNASGMPMVVYTGSSSEDGKPYSFDTASSKCSCDNPVSMVTETSSALSIVAAATLEAQCTNTFLASVVLQIQVALKHAKCAARKSSRGEVMTVIGANFSQLEIVLSAGINTLIAIDAAFSALNRLSCGENFDLINLLVQDTQAFYAAFAVQLHVSLMPGVAERYHTMTDDDPST